MQFWIAALEDQSMDRRGPVLREVLVEFPILLALKLRSRPNLKADIIALGLREEVVKTFLLKGNKEAREWAIRQLPEMAKSRGGRKNG